MEPLRHQCVLLRDFTFQEPAMEHDQKLYRARRRVEALTGFYVHAAIYVIVNAGLFFINLFTGPDWWVQWPIAGWGVGVIAHGAVVFGINHPRVMAWEDEKARELANRMP
jgi:hypothetical protein